MAHEVERRSLARYLEERNLKHTKQRDAILDVFLDATGHITSDDIYQKVRESHPGIGYTTVYRTMKLLCDAGLAHERHFDDGVARYEIAHEHHDHLVCLRCGKIVEFECAMIESTQNEIAARYGFRVLRHRHELYGHCRDCREEVDLEGSAPS
jgi:Fur family ferric uptake transcriptional regulator